jgi:hypothetical protein
MHKTPSVGSTNLSNVPN